MQKTPPYNGWRHLLKQERKRLGLTQAALGKMFEAGSQTVSRWETGRTEIPNNVTWWLHRNVK